MAPARNLQLSTDTLSMSNHVSQKETALGSVLKIFEPTPESIGLVHT